MPELMTRHTEIKPDMPTPIEIETNDALTQRLRLELKLN